MFIQQPRETVNERATDLLSAERSIAELRLACAEVYQYAFKGIQVVYFTDF
jgi:hypothetical protein